MFFRSHHNAIRLVLFFLFFMLMAHVLLNVFTIHTIQVTGVPAQAVINNEILPNNLLFFPSEKVRNDILHDYPQINDVKIRKHYPSTLEIFLEVKVPLARVTTNDGQMKAIDKNGEIISQTADQNLPLIEISSGAANTGSLLANAGVSTTLSFLQEFHELPFGRVSILDGQTIECISDTLTIVMNIQQDGSQAAHALQSIISGFRIKGSIPRRIDLRFAKPVVTF